MSRTDIEPTRASARLVEKRQELTCQESSDKQVLEKTDEMLCESPKANANAGIVINISKNAKSDYFIEGEDDEGIADYDDEQDESLYKDDEAIEDEEEVDDDDDNEDDESVDMKTKNHTRSKKKPSKSTNPEKNYTKKQLYEHMYVRSEGSVECRSG